MDPVLERFYTHTITGPIPPAHPEAGPCLLWTASCFPSGYGQFKVARRNWRAHRWVWIHLNGDTDLRLDHWACDTPACVNPDHLRPVTDRENLLRSDKTIAARNRAKTHCPANHPYAGDNLAVRERDNARICLTCRRKRDRERKAEIRNL